MPTETQHLEQHVAAPQSELNERDQRTDDLQFQLKDRESSRRDWFEEAQRLQAELDKRPSQIAMSLQTKIKRLEARLAERDALLRDVVDGKHTTPDWNQRMKAALSASAEPSEECNLAKATAFVERLVYCAGAQQSVATGYLRDILDVLKGRTAPSAPVECGERPRFNAWLNEVTHEEYTDNGVFKVQRHQELSVSDEQIAWDAWQARAALERKP